MMVYIIKVSVEQNLVLKAVGKVTISLFQILLLLCEIILLIYILIHILWTKVDT